MRLVNSRASGLVVTAQQTADCLIRAASTTASGNRASESGIPGQRLTESFSALPALKEGTLAALI